MVFLTSAPGQGEESTASAEIVPHGCLLIKSVGRYGRSLIQLDAVQAQIVAGKWKTPRAGDSITLPNGNTQIWESAKAGKDGEIDQPALAGGYAYFAVPSESERVMILEASGHRMVYVNGEPRTGDPYGTGYVRLPILLRKGTNEFLFHGSRSKLKMKLLETRAPALLDARDATLPDLVVGEPVQTFGALVVINATTQRLEDLSFVVAANASLESTRTRLPAIPPLSIRKVAFDLKGPAVSERETVAVEMGLVRKKGDKAETLDTTQFQVRVRLPDQTRKRTFRSTIDGSVQYYAVRPAQPISKDKPEGPKPALFLTLHGAAVEAIGQADAYSSKSWGHLVAPTNRRPYGFDWEDWGRLDALEVLDLAQRELRTDPRRTYLTGHSMGGHGTWHLGALFPDRFAAIGPSAGWISMFSYAGATRPANPSPMQEILLRAATPSDTLALAKNYLHYGVYILHGRADDNVPAKQAQIMKQHLSAFHHDLVYHEQPGAGHWWDVSDEPGADCVDWAPLFDFFARHYRPANESVRQVDFVTPNPGVSAWCYWVGIGGQIQQLKPSAVSLRHDPVRRRFVGNTENVAWLVLDLNHVQTDRPLTVELDSQKLTGIPYSSEARSIWLKRDGEKWSVVSRPRLALKGPHRYGPFKDAFRNNLLFVYGTAGTAEENAWSFAKARFDAETFWYRGNGSVEVISDKAFAAAGTRGRNVILYGNAATNTAWKTLLADSPVQVGPGRIRVGEREETGDDLACLFLRPRADSEEALVGVVSGTGPSGMRLTDRLPYFVAGIGFPDCLVVAPDLLRHGDAGVRGAGFFGLDWGVASGEFVWNK
jgi:dienelactone hydrolase